MNEKRKKIAILIPRLPEDTTLLIYNGIREEAQKQNFDAFFFICSYVKADYYSYVSGEETIFTLPSLKDYDGILLLGTFNDPYHIQGRLKERILSEACCPVIAVNYTDSFFPSITINYKQAMYELTNHFLTVHKFTKFCFLSGPMNQEDASLSFEGFLTAVKEHSELKIAPKIYYNGESFPAIHKIADFFLQDGFTPDVILCSNSFTSLLLYQELLSRGLKVPEDVCIADLNGSTEDNCLITTISVDCSNMGIRALQSLSAALKGETIPAVQYEPFALTVGYSCGCPVSNPNKYAELVLDNSIYFYMLKTKTFFLWDGVSEFTNLTEVIDHFSPYIIHMNSIQDIYLCLNSKQNRSNTDEDYSRQYTPFMCMRAVISHNHPPVFYSADFKREHLLPKSCFSDGLPNSLTFIPLHYKSHCLGYLAFRLNNRLASSCYIRQWICSLSIALENLYLYEKKKNVKKSEQLLLKDPVSKLDNLLSFEPKAFQLYLSLVKEKSSCFYTEIKLENLNEVIGKSVSFKHDLLVMTLGQIILKLMKKNMLCARIQTNIIVIMWGNVTPEQYVDYLNTLQKQYKENAMTFLKNPPDLITGSCYVTDASTMPLIEIMEQAEKHISVKHNETDGFIF